MIYGFNHWLIVFILVFRQRIWAEKCGFDGKGSLFIFWGGFQWKPGRDLDRGRLKIWCRLKWRVKRNLKMGAEQRAINSIRKLLGSCTRTLKIELPSYAFFAFKNGGNQDFWKKMHRYLNHINIKRRMTKFPLFWSTLINLTQPRRISF